MNRPAILALATLALTAPLHAQIAEVATVYIEGQFTKFDANGDGRLTAEEAKPIAELLKGADKDADGLFTLPEVLAHFRGQAARAQQPSANALAGLAGTELATRFKALDKDGNGKIEGEEFAQARWLKRLDANGDGGVTLDETKTLLAALTNQEPMAATDAPPQFQPDASSPREQAQQLKPAEHGIGAMLPDVAFADLAGKQHRLSDFTAKGKATVVALVSPSCPVSKRYLPTLAAMEQQCRAQGTAFLLVAPTATDTPEQLRAALKAAGLTAPCVPDPSGTFAKTLGALSTTDAFVVDARRTLVYRGAIDDQYGLGYSLDAPRQRYLADALAATLAGRTPAIAATEAPGCLLDLAKAQPAPRGDLTFHNRISRVLQANCVECHRAGGVAPFPLETHEQVAAKSGMIRKMVDRGLMPPWFAAPPAKGAHTPWANDRSLAARDKAELLAWLDAGKPAGDAKDAPLARQWPGEWKIGTPDAVVQIPTAIAVKATGVMPYQNVTVDTDFGGDKWVRGFEVQPTAREVVHHVLIFVREKEGAIPGKRRMGSEDEASGGFFAAYVPGNNHIIYPDGYAKPLPAGARIKFQIHYTPNGTATSDQVKIGLLFAKEAPKHVVHVAGIADVMLNIPAGAENHPETGAIPVPREVKLLAFMPHMHVRGKAFRYEVVLPDGTTRTLLDVPRYDFNWQLGYRYAEPPTIPAGSKIRATGWFDNSANNPANPDPNKTVRWGPQTYDEMMLGYVEYYIPSESGKVSQR